MKPEQITETLEQAASRWASRSVTRRSTGEVSGGGGLCKVKGQWCVIIDRKVAPAERAATLTEALAQLDTDGVPAARRSATPSRAARAARPAPPQLRRLNGQPERSARFTRGGRGPGSSSAYAPKGLESSGGTTEPPDSASAEKLPGPSRPRAFHLAPLRPPRPDGAAPPRWVGGAAMQRPAGAPV